VLSVLSIATIGGMLLTGWSIYNHKVAEHGAAQIGLGPYFLSSMSAYVMVTAFLFKRGSAESKDPGTMISRQSGRRKCATSRPRWGLGADCLFLFMGTALSSLYVLTFILHLKYCAEAENAEAVMHGEPITSMMGHLWQRPILVRILAELAERVSLHCGHRRAIDFPAVQGLARVSTCRGPSQRDRHLTHMRGPEPIPHPTVSLIISRWER
jgi:hypothetical protein